MSKVDQQRKNISKMGERLDIDFVKVAEDMKDRLKRMGIKLPHYGPRISDPAHTRGEDNPNLSFSAKSK